MTRYRTAFKGLRIVTLDHRDKWKKDKKIQDAFKALRTTKICGGLESYALSVLQSADIVLLAYNSAGEVRGLAGVDERDDELHVDIICNNMGKENRRGGYAPGKGLLDLLKKIAVKKKKDITLGSVSSAVGFYKRFGFKQHPGALYQHNNAYLIWEWRPSYARPRRFEYESVNSNYNSNSNSNRSSATTVKISPRTRLKKNVIKSAIKSVKNNIKSVKNTIKKTSLKSRKSKLKDEIREKRKTLRVLKNRYQNPSTAFRYSPTSSNSNHSSATVKPTSPNRSKPTQRRSKRVVRLRAQREKAQMKGMVAKAKESKKNLERRIIDAKNNYEKQHYKRHKKDRKNFIKSYKAGIREKNERIRAKEEKNVSL